MKKITKQQKDKNPIIYGYGSIEQLKIDLNKNNDGLLNNLTHWIKIIDADGHIRFIPCTKEYFYWYRNEMRNERRQNYRALEKCPISIDQMREDYDYEFVDPSYEQKLIDEKEQEEHEIVWRLVSKLSKYEQQILILHSEGYKDIEIAQKLNKSRSSIQEKRVKLLIYLKEKLTKL